MRIARRKPLACALAASLPLAVRALLLPFWPIPEPRIHDEFSHLLLADTLAHGRLVNPTHPMWIHFDSMHILVRPVYASIYPPASGAAMAVGQLAGGQPWFGVWGSVGLMCGALCWMLQGWVPPGWALLGALLAAARFGVFSYWMNSYYGGAMAAVGGALTLGAAARMLKRQRRRDSAIFAVGLGLLANSRPYEGLVFSVPIVVYVLWTLRNRFSPRRHAMPALLALGIAAGGMGFYFMRFTGSPLVMPYQYFRSNFTEAPHFVWQGPRPKPVYYHAETEHYYSGWEMNSYRDARAGRSPRGVLDKAKSYGRFYIGPFLAIPLLLALPWLWLRRRTRMLLGLGALFSIALALEVWNAPHYAAPAMGLLLLLVVEGLRHLRLGPGGRWAVPAVVIASLLLPVIHGGTRVGDGRGRAAVTRRLLAESGQHLILVRYAPTHDSGNEWVYNGADIDGSKVVWAREMDASNNQRLLRYFRGRRVWLVEPDRTPVRLSPYPSDGAGEGPLSELSRPSSRSPLPGR